MNIGIPDCCPICKGKLEIRTSPNGVKDLFCVNEKCPSRFAECIASFVEKLGVMGVASAMLEEWGIRTLDDIVKFVPDPKYKNQMKFVNELDKKMWCISKHDLFLAMSAFIYGIGKKELEKFWNKFGGDSILKDDWSVTGSYSVKESLIIDALPIVRANINTIVKDNRYNAPTEVDAPKNTNSSTKGTICFTGKLETMTRSQAQEKARNLGYEIADSVSKTLGTLVVADAGLKGAPSSKLKKAMSLGVKVMSESEFSSL